MKRKTWLLAASASLVAVTATGGVLIASGARHVTPTARESSANTATVDKGTLSATISINGTLTYRAQPDGSPYPLINYASGIYTKLPDGGAEVGCGDVLYRVSGNPVLLLCGTVPAYRELHSGVAGDDVRQLNGNLHNLGYDSAAGVAVDPNANTFTWKTQQALRVLQHDKGTALTGKLSIGDAVFLPEAVRIATVTGVLGGSAQPGAQVAQATSDTLEVQVALDPSHQREVAKGDRVRVTLPGNTSVAGTVDRLGRVAQLPAGQQNASAGDATIPAYISLDDPKAARGLDRAPVTVRITTTEVANALSVPVTAIVGKSGGGYAVEVVRGDGRRVLVAVKLGLYDTSGGRVQVEGDLHEGDHVVVPSS